MKRILTLFIFCWTATQVIGQESNYWQQETHYRISVALNDSTHALDGTLTLDYINHSPDTLHFIWFHLWPNAFKNDKTAFSDQLLENGDTRFYFSKESDKGYINRIDFTANGKPAQAADHPQHQDIIKLILPDALPPGKSTRLSTGFHVQLPANFSRGGHIGHSYQVTQWYPKPAVYDRYGWHDMPYLDQGEFYSEFGSFDVQITVPNEYVVAATGMLKDSTVQPGFSSYHYQQDRIHDFAWFADKEFIHQQDSLQLGNRIINLHVYHQRQSDKDWSKAMLYLKRAISSKSAWLGDYPYDVMSVVERPGEDDQGGMEYPTITLISHPGNTNMLDYLINHETGHNWFYGILGSNERKHPWMYEGMNSYYDLRYLGTYQPGRMKGYLSGARFLSRRAPDDVEDFMLSSIISLHKDQPIETPADSFHAINYGVIPYRKAARWMELLEKKLGQPMFDSMMRAYYDQWKFKHPYPEDFQRHAESFSGQDLSFLFYQLHRTGRLGLAPKKSFRVSTLINLKNADQHHDLFIAPAVGYNMYDRFMLGAFFHNYTLPVSRFRYALAPLYAFGSSQFNGIGRIAYDFYGKKYGSKLTISLLGARFSGDDFTDSIGNRHPQPFSKWVPGIRYLFGNKNPRSQFNAFIQWRTFFISETELAFSRDTIQQIDVISYPVRHRYLNQFRAVIENKRVLYPYQAIFDAEQGKGFVRLAFTGKYFFNYPSGGGLQTRFFAGKFLYTGTKTILTRFETDRYHLNMTGPKGSEDYTYSNYFIGRNEYDGLANQQIMIRDGGFKVRTDLLSQKIGKTDDWLTAINLSSTVPKNINPLSLLPIKIHLKVFADIGTYAEAWKKDATTGRFLYDAGFQLSLFKNVLNIYIPVIYSKVYDDYFKSTIPDKRFLKNISFSIDLQHLSTGNLFPQMLF